MNDFHLCYDGAVDIHIRYSLIRSQRKVSYTQVTVKACGPLVKLHVYVTKFVLPAL